MKHDEMRRVAVAALAGAVMLGASPAKASQWWYVAGSSDTIFFVDAETLVRSGNVVQVWLYSIMKESERGAKAAKTRSKRFCATNKHQSGMEVHYDANGVVVRTLPASPSDPIQDIVPDSIAEKISEVVCSPITAWTAKGATKLAMTPENAAGLLFAPETPPE